MLHKASDGLLTKHRVTELHGCRWVAGGGWRVAGGGWRVAGGGWRVAGGGLKCLDGKITGGNFKRPLDARFSC